MDSLMIKKENLVDPTSPNRVLNPQTTTSNSSNNFSDSEIATGSKRKQGGSDGGGDSSKKKMRESEKYNGNIVPPRFLAPLNGTTREEEVQSPMPISVYYDKQEKALVLAGASAAGAPVARSCKQFWRAGDYEEVRAPHASGSVRMDHVRVHPRFLHSNATSHKWALGAFAELLDNALDEAVNGATYVHVDVLRNQRDNNFMLLVEDNGGGMNPNKMRHCMSLGYSAKSKMANTIGQYGNGFKTSSMRLGEDVIVFSRSKGEDGNSSTLSVGLLSYTFLTATGQEDIVVPMVHSEKKGDGEWIKAGRTLEDWDATFDIILQWSPFATSQDFLNQSYASILYMKLPTGFRILLRGKEIEHHDLVNDMKMEEPIIYKPLNITEANGKNNNRNMVATRKIGFVKDADHHIDVQGFNVYHKNRLIKPFWRVWNAAGSDGRGVLGVVEANFIEPAHDKQGFERTTLLSRFEAKLIGLQKTYWSGKCHEIGYAARRNVKNHDSSSSGKPNKKGESSADGVKTSPVDGIQRFPQVRPVILTAQGDLRSGETPASQQNGSIDRTSFASPQPVPSSVGSAPQIAPHLRKLDIMRNGSNAVNQEGVNTSSNVGKHKSFPEMVGILMKNLQRERDIKQQLEIQLLEKAKELETEKMKSEKLEQDNLALLDILQKEKDLNQQLENTLQLIQAMQQQPKEKIMEQCKIEPNY